MVLTGAWTDPVIIIFACVITVIVTAFVRQNAPALGLVQQANARSSHHGAKPTGGGMALAVAGLLSGLWLVFNGTTWLYAPVLIGFALALVGFQDDRVGLPAKWRLAVQFVAILLALILIPTLHSVLNPLPQWLAWPLIIFAGLVWINFYNFMDGIDGMAASETAFLGTSVLVMVLMVAQSELAPVWVWTTCLVGASLVFLLFNWAPSRLFMGDSGAYFLSFSLFIVALFGVGSGIFPIGSAIILPGLFVCDAGVTLLRRMSASEKWQEGHRTHAYQNISRQIGHARTVLIYLTINIVWLLPMALLVAAAAINPWAGLVIAYVPLLVFVVMAKAGRSEDAR